MMSVNQWTPESILAASMNTAKAPERIEMHFAKALLFTLFVTSIAAEGITVVTSSVVEDGYETSAAPSISIGRQFIPANSKSRNAAATARYNAPVRRISLSTRIRLFLFMS